MAEPQFSLERIFVKDLSFEIPNPQTVFNVEWKPQVDIKLSSNAEKVSDTHYMVTLSVTVNANNQDVPAFVAEVHQAGFFLMQDIPEDQIPQILGAYCPSILFPFVREAINEMVCKGNFPSLLLSPINFDAAFAESQQQKSEEITGNA